MATDLMRAYLDWQSEVGTDEVILPHPPRLSRPAERASAAPPQPHPEAGAANPGERLGDRQGESPIAPGAGSPGGIDASTLFQSLSHALEDAAAPKTMPLPSAKPARTLDIHFPVFLGLPDFWAYLEKTPEILQVGDADAAGGTLVRATGRTGAPLAMIGMEPSDADAEASLAFQGGSGALLEKMMKAIRLEKADLYLSNLVKLRVPGKSWSRRELSRLVPLLHIELGLCKAPFTVLLGEACAQAILKTGRSLDEMRQETHVAEGGKFVVTYHPEELLRKEELKRKAWEDLQWLQRKIAEARGPA